MQRKVFDCAAYFLPGRQVNKLQAFSLFLPAAVAQGGKQGNICQSYLNKCIQFNMLSVLWM